MEPRGGIEPPHVYGVVHGRRFRFCYSTRHIYAIPLNYHTTVLVATSRIATRAAVFSGIAPGHTFSGSRSPVAVCQRAALLIGLPALLTAAQVSLSRFACVRLPRTGATQQFGRQSTFSGPVRRCWVAGIVSFHSHRNLQDLNLRSLPLWVKRRIPPRPRFRMPPSFRGVSSVAFGAYC